MGESMAEPIIELSEDLRSEMSKHSQVPWLKVVEKAVRGELEEITKRRVILAALNKLFENSKLTEQDALRLGDKVNEGMFKRLKEEGLL